MSLYTQLILVYFLGAQPISSTPPRPSDYCFVTVTCHDSPETYQKAEKKTGGKIVFNKMRLDGQIDAKPLYCVLPNDRRGGGLRHWESVFPIVASLPKNYLETFRLLFDEMGISIDERDKNVIEMSILSDINKSDEILVCVAAIPKLGPFECVIALLNLKDRRIVSKRVFNFCNPRRDCAVMNQSSGVICYLLERDANGRSRALWQLGRDGSWKERHNPHALAISSDVRGDAVALIEETNTDEAKLKLMSADLRSQKWIADTAVLVKRNILSEPHFYWTSDGAILCLVRSSDSLASRRAEVSVFECYSGKRLTTFETEINPLTATATLVVPCSDIAAALDTIGVIKDGHHLDVKD